MHRRAFLFFFLFLFAGYDLSACLHMRELVELALLLYRPSFNHIRNMVPDPHRLLLQRVLDLHQLRHTPPRERCNALARLWMQLQLEALRNSNAERQHRHGAVERVGKRRQGLDRTGIPRRILDIQINRQSTFTQQHDCRATRDLRSVFSEKIPFTLQKRMQECN